MSAVRQAARAEVPQLADALARAFHDDPLFEWLFPRERARPAASQRYFALRARRLLAQRSVYTTDDLAGAALWARPGHWRDPPLPALRQLALIAPGLGRRLPGTLRALGEVERRHPPAPHWYLAVLGCVPDRRGRGIGSALLEPVLARCDSEGVPAYLETAKARNVGFYERHGFATCSEVDLDGGPRLWLMWRAPRGSDAISYSPAP